jgi:hypothetical protein
MEGPRFARFLIINVLFLLLSMSLTGVTKAAAPISFSGQLDVVFVNTGRGIFSDTLGTTFSGVIDPYTANGSISNGTTTVNFSCCIAAGGLSISNNEILDAETATILNIIAGYAQFHTGETVDIVQIEGDAATANGGRIEVGLSYVLAADAFANESLANYPFDPAKVRMSLFFIAEHNSADNELYSVVGKLDTNGPAAPVISGLMPSSGVTPGGTSVTINGTNFGTSQGNGTVTFGSTEASITTWTDTEITCTAPVHAEGIVNVVVTRDDGQEDILAGGFTYIPPYTFPAISDLSPLYGPTTGGTTVTIFGTDFGDTQGNGSVSFGTAAATITSWSDTEITCITPFHTGGVVDVIVTRDDSARATQTSAFTYEALSLAFYDSFDDSGFTNSNWVDLNSVPQTWSFVTLNGSDLGYHSTVNSLAATQPAAKAANNGKDFVNAGLHIETLVRIDSHADAYSTENTAGVFFSFADGSGYAAGIQLDYDGVTTIDLFLNVIGIGESDIVSTPVSIEFDTFYKLVVQVDSDQTMHVLLYDLNRSFPVPLYLHG